MGLGNHANLFSKGICLDLAALELSIILLSNHCSQRGSENMFQVNVSQYI